MLFFLIPTETNEERWEWLMSHIGKREMIVFHQEAYSILENHDDADDVVSAALVKGATRCHQLRDEKKFFSWMMKIIRNEAYAYLNINTVHNKTLQAKMALIKPPYEESAEYIYIREQERVRLRAAIKDLKSPDKEILTMRFFEEQGLPEIAEKLNMNYHTVRSKYQRILKRLRREMEADDHDK